MRKFYKVMKIACALFILVILFACSKRQAKNEPEGSPSPIIQGQATEATPSKDDGIIGSFSTNIIDKSPGRMTNLRLASKKINGYVLKPGKEFSFNRIVGKADNDRGFRRATVLDEKGNKKVDDGGGICQISSTLYNAAVKAGLTVTERHSHKRDVGYIPQGQDAAINYGVQDFKFINNKPYPIKLVSKVNKNSVEIYIERH